MKSIEIVTHFWEPPGQELYSGPFKRQLESIALAKRKVEVVMTAVIHKDDSKAVEMVKSLGGDGISTRLIRLNHRELFRRAIGRNRAAKTTKCDVIWFTDCDYLFGDGALDKAVELCNDKSKLYYPKTVYEIHDGKTVPRSYKKAIGGIQIVHGEFAKERGYLDGTNMVRAVDPGLGFRRCTCDVKFRKWSKLKPTEVDIPNVSRIMHKKAGRDFDVYGLELGESIWW